MPFDSTESDQRNTRGRCKLHQVGCLLHCKMSDTSKLKLTDLPPEVLCAIVAKRAGALHYPCKGQLNQMRSTPASWKKLNPVRSTCRALRDACRAAVVALEGITVGPEMSSTDVEGTNADATATKTVVVNPIQANTTSAMFTDGNPTSNTSRTANSVETNYRGASIANTRSAHRKTIDTKFKYGGGAIRKKKARIMPLATALTLPRILRMHYCGESTDILTKLTNLKYLKVKSTKAMDEVLQCELAFLDSLETLHLETCRERVLQEFLNKPLPNLTKLYLVSVNFRNTLPTSIIDNLREVSLMWTPLTEEVFLQLSHARSIETLHFKGATIFYGHHFESVGLFPNLADLHLTYGFNKSIGQYLLQCADRGGLKRLERLVVDVQDETCLQQVFRLTSRCKSSLKFVDTGYNSRELGYCSRVGVSLPKVVHVPSNIELKFSVFFAARTVREVVKEIQGSSFDCSGLAQIPDISSLIFAGVNLCQVDKLAQLSRVKTIQLRNSTMRWDDVLSLLKGSKSLASVEIRNCAVLEDKQPLSASKFPDTHGTPNDALRKLTESFCTQNGCEPPGAG